MSRLHCIWLVAVLAAVPAEASYFYAGGGITYTPNTGVWDGASDHIRLTSDGPTGLGDDITTVSFSFWYQPTAGDGTTREILFFGSSGNSRRLSVTHTTANRIQVIGRNSTPTDVFHLTATTTTILAGAVWYHIYVCVNLTDTGLRHIYIDGTDQTLTVGSYNTSGLIDTVGTNYFYTVGASNAGASDITGALSAVWFNDIYLDSPTTFRSGGNPVDPGSVGTNAVFWLHTGSGNDFIINSGTAGNLTLTGGLGTTTPPP